jgi:TonB family protein
MSAVAITSLRAPILAWDVATEDDARFNRIVRTVLVICTLLCLGVLLAPIVKEDRSQPQELPPRLAKMLLERAPPPPPPPVVKPEKLKDTLKDAAPEAAVAVPPKAVAMVKPPEPNKALPVPEARRPLPDKPPGEIDAARRKAAGVGLLAMASELAEIHGAPAAVQLRTDIKQGPGVGTGSGPGVGAGADVGVPLRSLLTSNATGGSGGINTAGYSRDTGGGGLAGRATTLVEGAAGGGGGGGAGGGGSRSARAGDGAGKGANAGGTVQRGNSGKAARSTEEIKLVFDRNKGAIYAIYNRALREDPGLQGKVVLELTIAPSGAVSECRIVSSDLKSPELEAKLLARIRQFDFGAKDVDQMIAKFPVDFLPS